MAHLPDELVERLLRDEGFQPGGRPSHFRAPVPGSVAENPGPPASTEHAPPVGWLFKETGTDRNRRRHSEADRWRNSGGKAGARDLPAGAPVVRRRYGKLTPAATNAPLLAWCAPPPPPGEKRKAAQRTTRPTAKEGFAYHEYTLLDPSKQREDGALQDDVSRYLFHVVPVRDAMAEAPRLGLPQEVELSADETRSLSAILRVEKFEALPGTNSAGELGPRAQPPGAGLDGASAAAAAGAPTETEVLPVEEVIRRICDTSYEPGTRPALLKPAQHGWIFKEPARPGRLRRGQHEDRWKHSGGTKGAKDLYLPAPSGGLALDTSAQDLCDRPVVRRRNGVIQPPGRANSRCYRYNQYTLLRKAEGEASGWEEDPASPILFHVQPPDSKAPRSAGRKKGKKAKPPPPLPDAPSEYSRLLAGPTGRRQLAQEIPSFPTEDMNGLPTLRSSSTRKRGADPPVQVVSATKRQATTATAVPVVVPVVVPHVVSVMGSGPPPGSAEGGAHASVAPTSLQDAIKFMEWWQGDPSSANPLSSGGSSGTFRRTRSTFAQLGSGRSDGLSALPSLGWLGPTEPAELPASDTLFDHPLGSAELGHLPSNL